MPRLFAAAVLVLALGAGCALGPFPGIGPFARKAEPGPAPDPGYGLAVVESEGIVDFYARASSFYTRLAQRRFNTLSTFRDEVLRDYFRTETAFTDYYADLAQAFTEAHFERNRPLRLDVVEFRLEAPGTAEVVTRIVGENGRPLRWGETDIDRVDRWERIQGQWWIVPRKL